MAEGAAATIRAAIESLPDGTSHGEAPKLADVFFPQSHLKALHPDVAVVTGMRGAGKTFWWAALQEAPVRNLIGERDKRGLIRGKTKLLAGFGVRSEIDKYPSKDVLGRLLAQGLNARIIWRTVQAWQIARRSHPLRREQNWPARAKFVQDNPESIDRMFAERDDALEREGRHLVVIYDALDRSADDWQTMYRIIRGLLQTALDMRGYRRIRVKMFLRTDQFEPAEIGDFPDASKVLSSAVQLNWPRQELYGLLWHLLGNASAACEEMRTLMCGGEVREGQADLFSVSGSEMWRVPDALVFDEARQRNTFHLIAGEWMGRDRRRGRPYTWIPNHLSDTEGKVSPRSFVAALKAAAENSSERHPDHKYALHYDSIKGGVQRASAIRVNELREDYPWVDVLLQDLRGMVVPCRFKDIERRWAEKETLSRLRKDIAREDVKLPPSRIDDGADGVRWDLELLSVFQRLHDGRVNIPDVFRVGYGLGRRGGVRPVR